MTTTPAPAISAYDLSGTAVGPFATGWKYGEAGDVSVWLETDGVPGPNLTPGVDYTLTGPAPTTDGGTVTLSADLIPLDGWSAVGADRVVIARRTVKRQALALPDTEGHRPRATEQALDKLMRAAEEQAEGLARTMTSPIGEEGLVMPLASKRALRILGFGSLETGAKPIAVASDLPQVAEDVAASAANALAAQTARDGADEAAALATLKAAMAADSADAANASQLATAQSVIDAGLSIAQAQALVDSLDGSELFTTIALGRAAVVDGKTFKVGTVAGPGIDYYRRDSSTTQTFLFNIPSATELGKRVQKVKLILKTGDGRNLVGVIAKPWVILPADRKGVDYDWKYLQTKTFGSPSLTIRDYGDTTDLLSAQAIKDANGQSMLDEALWGPNDTGEGERDAVTSNIHLVQRPNPSFRLGFDMAVRSQVELPSPLKPVVVDRVFDGLLVKSASVQYDDPARRSNADFVTDKFIFAGPTMSLGAFVNTWAPTWHWSICEKRGRRYHYGNIASRNEGNGQFARIQPSTDTWALRVGPMSQTNLNAVSGGHPVHDFVGDWHGNKEEFYINVTVGGVSGILTAAPGTTVSGSNLVIERSSRMYMPYVATSGDRASHWIGEVSETTTVDATGRHFVGVFDVGQRFAITAGTAALVRGATITGATSGAQAYVCLVPTYDMTGSAGAGDLAGTILVDEVSGTWDPGGENFTIGGLTAGHATGQPSGAVSEVNGYVGMLISRGVNRAKAQGASGLVVTVGQADDVQHTLATGADGVDKDSAGVWFDDDGEVDGGMIYEVLLPNGPSTPPGDFSLCGTSVLSVQDRAEGVVKVYPNRASGTAPLKWARRMTVVCTYRWRDGAPV